MIFEDGRAIDKTEYIKFDKTLLQNTTKWDAEMAKLSNYPDNAELYVFFDFDKIEKYETQLNQIVQYMAEVKKPNQTLKAFLLYENENELYSYKGVSVLGDLNKELKQIYGTELQIPVENLQYEVGINQKVRWKLARTISFDQVITANKHINNVVAEIESNKLSKYEQFLAAYAWVSSFNYQLEKPGQDWRESRNISYVLNGESIVCAGYAELLKGVCDKLQIPASIMVEKNLISNVLHAKCLVDIRDPKYGINGIYVSDPTFDAYKKDFENSAEIRCYQHHLMPLKSTMWDVTASVSNSNYPIYRFYDLYEDEYDNVISKRVLQNYEKNYSELAKDKIIKNYITEEHFKEAKAKTLQLLPKNHTPEQEKDALLRLQEKAIANNHREVVHMHKRIRATKQSPLPAIFNQALQNVYHNLNMEYYNPNYTTEQKDKLIKNIIKYNKKLGQDELYMQGATFSQEKDYTL